MGSVNHDQGDILLMAVPLPRDDKWIAKIEANFPTIKQVRWVQREWKTPPTPLPEDLLDGVTLLCTGLPIEAEQAALLTKVRYVQIISAGADRWLGNPLYQNPNVTFCTSSGTHPPQIAEWVIGSYLMMSHQFLSYHAEQQKARWSPLADLKIQDSPGLRMGILGYGAIGRQCARLGQALGMEVYAYTRSPKPTAESKRDDSYVVPGTGDPEGTIPTQWFSGPSREDVNRFLSQDLDLLVLALPLTESTKYILGREQFEMLSKRKAFVSNIARGAHIDTEALIEALREGKIRGAALDVTDPEPLPDGHELWTAPNVFITPHVSWKTPHYFERVLGIIERNLEGMRDGKAMINVVDKAHHY